MYRESEKKIVKTRIILTRGEVDQILRAHLVSIGKLPAEKPEKTWRSLEALDPKDLAISPPADVDGKTAPWEAWPCYAVGWTEELPK